MDDWFARLESKILTIIKARMQKQSKYRDVYFTSESGLTPTKFPTVSIEELQPSETGQDLTNQTVNAVVETIQVITYTDTTKADCKKLMSEVILQFKRLGFNATMMPIYQTSFENVHQGIARFRRVIGAADADLGER